MRPEALGDPAGSGNRDDLLGAVVEDEPGPGDRIEGRARGIPQPEVGHVGPTHRWLCLMESRSGDAQQLGAAQRRKASVRMIESESGRPRHSPQAQHAQGLLIGRQPQELGPVDRARQRERSPHPEGRSNRWDG